jgi:hypothetical protein
MRATHDAPPHADSVWNCTARTLQRKCLLGRTMATDIAAYEVILKSLTPQELAVEYSRACEQPPAASATADERILGILDSRRTCSIPNSGR